MELQEVLVKIWRDTEVLFAPFLKDLDPSLFQNIVLAVLAISIPFTIVFLTDLLNSKDKNLRSEFEKMVLSEQVLGTKTIFWVSIIGVIFLAFFSGTDVSVGKKLIAIIFAVLLTWLMWRPFTRILRFSEGYKPEFEVSFLKSLNLSKVFAFSNKLKMERMVRVWRSFWSEKSAYNEREYSKLFINHIDDLIEAKEYGVAVTLGQTYKSHLDKRDRFSLGYEVLPKIFEWHDKLWEAEQAWLSRENYKEQIQKLHLFKYFPDLKKQIFNFLNKEQSRPDFFWNWDYFARELFPDVAKTLLYDGHGPYELFTYFRKYVGEAETKLEAFEEGDKKQRWWNHLMGLFGVLSPLFFDNIDKISNKYEIWEHYFPLEWKITVTNSSNRFSRVILHEFLQWSHKRLSQGDVYDKDLSEVVDGLFPNAHHNLFPAFLILLFSAELKYAVQKKANFFITNTGISWSGEKDESEIQQMIEHQDQSQREETISLIFEYFSHWPLLKIYRNDISEEDFSNWSSNSEEKRKEITNKVRKLKLNKALTELRGDEIIKICEQSERDEHQRQVFIELLELVLKRIS